MLQIFHSVTLAFSSAYQIRIRHSFSFFVTACPASTNKFIDAGHNIFVPVDQPLLS